MLHCFRKDHFLWTDVVLNWPRIRLWPPRASVPSPPRHGGAVVLIAIGSVASTLF